jgi:lipopolysaccharide assembly outer membrane protein LptD (OstA)
MKMLVLTIALLASLPIAGQDRPKSPAVDSQIFRKAGRYRIETSTATDQVTISSDNLEWIDKNACLIRLTGSVEISTKGVTVQADEADYHCGTGEVEPRGNVLFKPFSQP